MIFTERTITVVNDSATINKPLILYRGDKNIELKITIVESQFKFRSTGASNVIETSNASYAQLVIDTPYDLPIFSEITATENGTVIFVISAAMIDEVREVGIYDIQIRLLDDSKQSRASIPPVRNAIEIREPMAIEDGSPIDSNAVNTARVNRALTTTSAPLEVFDSQGNYIKKTWGDGDPITDAALNKIEAGIDGVNKKIANANNINDTTASATTTYSSNKIETIKGNISSQIKEIENNKAAKQELEVERERINALTTLTEGSTTGDAELIDGRIGANGIIYDNIGGAIRGQINSVNNKLQSFTLSDSGNLIDITLLEKGKKLNDDGTIVDRADSSITPYIEIDRNNVYVYNFIADICFYNDSKEYVSGYSFVNVNEDAPATLNIPDTGNVKYVRFNVWNDKAETSVFTLSQSYVKNLKCKYVYSGECERYDASIRPIKVWDKGNLLDTNNLIDGYLLNSTTGKLENRSGSKVTDFIEINKEGEYTFNFIANIGFYDTNKQFISGYDASTNNDNPIDLVIPEGDVKYVRISLWTDQMKGYDVLALATSFNKNLKHLYMYENVVSCTDGEKNYMENPLTGKSFIFFGDSWCAGNSSAGGGWADWLKRKNPSITVKNCGVHGSDWWQCYNKWFVVDKDTLPNNADYIIIEAYTNGLYVDVDQVAKPLGEVDEFTYYNSVDEIIALGDTFAVDLEKVLYSIVTKWNGKKIGLMFPYKSADMLRQNNAFRQFREQVFKCCRKYNIPVFDNFDSCNIPSWKQEYVDKYFWHGDDNREHGDGVHLNAAGYDIICPPIENWLKTL